MNLSDKLAILEGILFASGEPLEIKKAAEICEVSKATIIDFIRILNDRYDGNNSAFQVLQLGNSCQICTRPELAPYIQKALESKRMAPLSNAAMEVLTIIAYNQPISKSFVENVRGVDSSSVVNSLVEKGLVEEAGRLDVPGKPIAYKTTTNFLRCFGLKSLEELPPLKEEKSLLNSKVDEEV